VSLFGGAAWEYEAAGKSEAFTDGLPVGVPRLKGSSGIGELGISILPAEGGPFSFELAGQGYTGKRRGFSGNIMFSFTFR
jgi:hypothetical protein